MATLLGIDVGTSGCKAVLVDETGSLLGQASAEYPLHVPKPLWSEQAPEDWWEGVQRCMMSLGATRPDAIGLTGQMHGSVFLDEDDRVIRPAILWNDQRTWAECEEIDRVVGPEAVRRITCNPPLTGFQLPKLLWLRNHEPDNYRRVKSLLLPKDYVRFKLTGVKATEVSDASGTGILDVPNRRWSQEMLSALSIEASILPEVFESPQVTGRTADGIPVVGGGGDQAAGAVGTGAVEPGIVSVSLGTSGVVFTALNQPNADPSGSAHTFCHANGKWHAMGVMLSCGGALRWYRDTLGGRSYDDLAAEAEQIDPGCDGLTFLPYLTGERCPHNDPFAKATFAGATLRHGKPHFSRAVFEGVSFGLLDGMRLLEGLGATATDLRVTGGGAKSKFWVQLLADMFQSGCSTLRVDEGPAFGAAVLAGVGAGVWPNVVEACRKVVKTHERFEPSGINYEKDHQRFRALYSNLAEWYRL